MKKLIIILLLLVQSSIGLAAELQLLVDYPGEGVKKVLCHDAKIESGIGVTCQLFQKQTDFYPIAHIVKIEILVP